jgi:hypothetical protein
MIPQIDDLVAFIVECLRDGRDGEFSNYGYELYIPNVVLAFIQGVEGNREHPSGIWNSARAVQLSSAFYDAAWVLCRQGVLRPSIQRSGLQATDDGSGGNGYSITTHGREWISASGSASMLPLQPSRLAMLFDKLSKKLGPGFLQRANESSSCYRTGAHLACCALCGAAAESVLLAVAIAKTKDEPAILATYRSAQGRRRVVDLVVGNAAPATAEQFRSVSGLLHYWRDEAAHGLASTISEIEAHEALSRLLRFAQFAVDNWTALTKA